MINVTILYETIHAILITKWNTEENCEQQFNVIKREEKKMGKNAVFTARQLLVRKLWILNVKKTRYFWKKQWKEKLNAPRTKKNIHFHTSIQRPLFRKFHFFSVDVVVSFLLRKFLLFLFEHRAHRRHHQANSLFGVPFVLLFFLFSYHWLRETYSFVTQTIFFIKFCDLLRKKRSILPLLLLLLHTKIVLLPHILWHPKNRTQDKKKFLLLLKFFSLACSLFPQTVILIAHQPTYIRNAALVAALTSHRKTKGKKHQQLHSRKVRVFLGFIPILSHDSCYLFGFACCHCEFSVLLNADFRFSLLILLQLHSILGEKISRESRAVLVFYPMCMETSNINNCESECVRNAYLSCNLCDRKIGTTLKMHHRIMLLCCSDDTFY